GKLHVRLLGIFSILAVAPAVLVVVLAVYLLNMGIESWFSAKVNRALEGSLQVSEAYLAESERGLVLELQALVQEPMVRDRPWLLDGTAMRDWLRGQMEQHRLDDLVLVDSEGAILNQGSALGVAGLNAEVLGFIKSPVASSNVMSHVDEGRVVAVAPAGNGTWLVGQRWMNPAILARVNQTNEAFVEYENLLKERGRIRWIVSLMLGLMAAATLAGAVWIGIRLANKIVRPITALVHGTNRVSAGDLDVRLTPNDDDELGVLTQAFNRMTTQLGTQRELVERKNRELDERRKQMEAVLTGVTAAVLGVDAHGEVKNANRAAMAMLGAKVGMKLSKTSPELDAEWKVFVANPRPLGQRTVKLSAEEGDTKTLLVRMVPNYVEGGKVGSVVMTCDDITPLIGAQRLAAWRDVARRLAHEIKNPLTPIQLSAERLRRRYLDKLPEEDRELFAQLTATIVQQTEDMRKMTNEFSDFARMPTAVFQTENLVDLVEKAVVLQKGGRKGIDFDVTYAVKGRDADMECDRGQVNRVLVNVLENAVNAVEERPEPVTGGPKGKKTDQGKVTLVVRKTQDDKLQVSVADNGKGLPPDVEVEKLFDPYVTTRKGGTGLGLAIVRKVMDEHDGTVRLLRRPEGGTLVELTFSRKPTAPHDKEMRHEPEPVAG
ncbi:MAG: ATP-binding protein, partial [Alphaproteobacteria bacterium]